VPHIGLAVSRRETEVAFTRHQRRAPAHDIPSERVGERSPALLLQIPGTGVIWKITNAAANGGGDGNDD
jgi:hypothetical protein